MERVSQGLAAFVAASRWESLPEDAKAQARRGVLNFAGCMLAARGEPEIRMLRETFPADDALVYAAASTAFDYDDTHLPTVIHATPPVGGALFALAKIHPMTGRDFLHAFALGVEVSCRLGNTVTPGHYEQGWHITSTCGVFGAAMACACALKLSPERILSCLGLAATQSAGLVEMLGSMARVLNAGVASRNGLASALLAAKGFEGPARPLEGRRGFFNVFGGSRKLECLAPARWAIHDLAYKPYPSGVVLHALIDGCLELRASGKKFDDVEIKMHPLAIERTDRPNPGNAIEARLSAQHAVAVAFLRGKAGVAEFGDAAAADPQIVAMRKRVKVTPDETLDKMAARIGDVHVPAARRLDDARLEAKFREQAGAQADAWKRFVEGLESAPRVRLPD
ncbi:MAG TPA: MmgE/PrpD family protein [Burkholderiales bacterium]